MADVLYRWFTCDFCHVNVADLKSKFIESFSKSLQGYTSCRRKYQLFGANPLTKCISILKEVCENAKIKAIKSIRIQHMETIEYLLQRLPDLKVIYLIRDPRGKLASQAALDSSEWRIVSKQAKVLCDKMTKNLEFLEQLRKQYQGRLTILMYEKLAVKPIETSRRMYAFMNLTFTPGLYQYVQQVTRSEVDKTQCYWCTKITNSEITASGWRLRVKYKDMVAIDSQCGYLYDQLGYIKVRDENHLRNLTESLVSNDSDEGIFL